MQRSGFLFLKFKNIKQMFLSSPCRAIGLIKKFEMNQLNYRLSHPVAALQTGLTKDMDKYSRIRFDYASFDAQVFGKQSLMRTNHDQEMSQFPDCKFIQCISLHLKMFIVCLVTCFFGHVF